MLSTLCLDNYNIHFKNKYFSMFNFLFSVRLAKFSIIFKENVFTTSIVVCFEKLKTT